VRKASLGLLMAAGQGTRRPLAFVEDTAVPPEQLVPYVRDFSHILARHGLQAGFYGHCSVGCLHIRPFIDLRVPAELTTLRQVAEEVLELVIRYGGVNSSEHGDGLARSEFNRRMFGEPLYEAMRQVKQLFDPDSLMNPGKIVDASSLEDHLRDPELAPAGPLETQFRFPQGGMRDAADRCMNIGACRKTDAGVMCPSYMATREEEHATRGRANALVRALSNPDPRAALGDERLHEIMDLCLECKACKRECPLNVDMASLKSEFLHHYHAVHGTPVRARAFAAIRRLNSFGAATAPISNRAARLRPLRRALDAALGITPHRPLPHFERVTLVDWFERRGAPGPRSAPRGRVVLLADSFTTFSEPSIGRACVELLELAGWQAELYHRGCCGRASISKGLLDQARSRGRRLVDDLAPYAAAGLPIAGWEPSCTLTLRDEIPALLPDHPGVADVAKQTRLIGDLLLTAIDEGSLRLAPVFGPDRRVVFHGHCHEKAITGTDVTRALLSRIPGVAVEELDCGCCGMAGSFGFESEHYDLSMRIGELRLFPRLRAEPDDTLVVATGVSCRQQIAHGTGRNALHPIELIRQAVSVAPGS
jgi:Fe-S oxidoreductase